MFEALGSALDTLTIPLDGNALADVFALHARFTATLVAAVGEFDHEGLWDLDAATSMTAWLKDRCALSGLDAHRWAVRAKKLHRLPITVAAGLTPAQIDVVLAHVSARHLALFASHEATVVPTLIGLSVEDTATVMGQWRDRADHDTDMPPEPDRELHCSRTLDGRRVLHGHADGEGGALIDTALRLATTKDCPGDEPRTPAVKRADALIDICRFFLDHQHHQRGGRHRPHVNVIIDLETLEERGQGQLLDGTVLPAGDISRLLSTPTSTASWSPTGRRSWTTAPPCTPPPPPCSTRWW